MREVFCENCKFIHEYYNGTPDCHHPSNIEILTRKNAITKNIVKLTIREISQKNKDNDCIYYKRKWYAFWVKGDK